MAFCSQCGAESVGKFCAGCGSPTGTAPAAPPPAPGPQFGSVVLEDHIASALCYSLWFVTGVLFLVLEPYNRNKTVRFHALQSTLAGAAVLLVFGLLSQLAFMPVFGILFTLALILYPILAEGLFLLLMFKAYNKERWVLPVVGPLAEKQASS